jgi:xanthine dehydrogenase accessory factor
MAQIVLIRGGGDLASGVAVRLFRAGFQVIITELPQPLAVRRTVSFAEAVYERTWEVEKIRAQRADSPAEIAGILDQGDIPVLVDPEASLLRQQASLRLKIGTVVDARMTKRPAARPMPRPAPRAGDPEAPPLLIGLGPGFNAGTGCHAVIETMRGHTLGRVYWQGSAMADTNLPEGDPRRVLRAPSAGTIQPHAEIGQRVEAGQILAEVRSVDGQVRLVTTPLAGILRGMIRPGLTVTPELKIGDVDARNDPNLCYLVSDKSLAVGGGVLEAILRWSNGRGQGAGLA